MTAILAVLCLLVALMLGDLGDYMESALVNWFRGTTFPAAPATVYVALYTVAPTDAGGGTEVTGGAYARTAITWGAESGGVASNSAQVQFPIASADWGTVVAAALKDASSGGNHLAWKTVTNVAVNSGMRYVFDAGQLSLTAT